MNLLLATLFTLLVLSQASPCTVSIVGSGLSGVYTAYRLSTGEDSIYSPNEICLFESSSMMGGRLLPLEDSEDGQVLEMGIETFDTGRMPLFTELVEFLGVDSVCVVKRRSDSAEKRSEGQQEKNQFSEGSRPVLEELPEEFELPEDTIDMSGQGSEQGVEQSGEQSSEQKTELLPAGLEGSEETERCGSRDDIKKLFFIRNKILTSDSTEVPFHLKESLEKIKDLPRIAFKTVLANHLNIDELEALREELDADTRWEKVSAMIQALSDSEVTYKGVPISELNMRMVLTDSLDLSDDEIEAAIFLSGRFPRLRSLMSMNFELFAIQYMRNIAAGEGELRRIGNKSGLRTIIDIMSSEMLEKGVQIYFNAKLDNVHVTESGAIVMHFDGVDRVIVSERLFLAVNRKNLDGLSGSDLMNKISPEASELLGNLESLQMIKGAVFYEDSWWRKYDLTGDLFTDTGFNKISYHTLSTCAEEEECPGWIKFEHWGTTGGELNFDIVNPVGIATVLSSFSEEGPTEETTEGSEETTESSEESTEEFSEQEILQRGREKLRSKIVLEFIHRALMNIHKKIPDFDAELISKPTSVWIANWKHDGVFNFGTLSLPSRINYRNYINIVLEPVPSVAIHLINSDFSEFTDWDHSLESSIVQAERALNKILGMQKPEFFNEKIYKAVVEV